MLGRTEAFLKAKGGPTQHGWLMPPQRLKKESPQEWSKHSEDSTPPEPRQDVDSGQSLLVKCSGVVITAQPTAV